MPSPAKRREAVEHVREVLGRDRVSERRACKVPGQCRSTQRRTPAVPGDEAVQAGRMVGTAAAYGRYGCHRIAALRRAEGFVVNRKRVGRLWRREGLKVPARQPKRGRLWLGDGSCIRPRPGRKGHVRSDDLDRARTHDGRAFRMPTVIDEFTRECLASDVARRLTGDGALGRPSGLFVRRGEPVHIRSDNGPESTAKVVRERLGRVGVTTRYIEPGSPWRTTTSSASTASSPARCWSARRSTRRWKPRC